MLIAKLRSKSQSAVEFIVLASFMLLVIMGFFAIASSRLLEAKDEGNRQIAEDIADFAYREIEIAKSASDGYSRSFEMPRAINGISYNISIIDNRELVVNYFDNEYVRFLPSDIAGNIVKGNNLISRSGGVVIISQNQT